MCNGLGSFSSLCIIIFNNWCEVIQGISFALVSSAQNVGCDSDAATSSIIWLSSASDRQDDSQSWGWIFWLHFSAFFSEILFFWKLVSHGGLDFSIFVSSTIWNQCFRSKNCSTAEVRLQRSSCTQDWLFPSRSQGKTWNSGICSWVCLV